MTGIEDIRGLLRLFKDECANLVTAEQSVINHRMRLKQIEDEMVRVASEVDQVLEIGKIIGEDFEYDQSGEYLEISCYDDNEADITAACAKLIECGYTASIRRPDLAIIVRGYPQR